LNTLTETEASYSPIHSKKESLFTAYAFFNLLPYICVNTVTQ